MYAMGSMYDLAGQPLLKLTQKQIVSTAVKGGAAGVYEVEVAAGMDPLQAIAIVIAAPQTLEN